MKRRKHAGRRLPAGPLPAGPLPHQTPSPFGGTLFPFYLPLEAVVRIAAAFIVT
jgi:hypothetical protein